MGRGKDRQTDGIDFGMYSQSPFEWCMVRLAKLKISWRRGKQYTFRVTIGGKIINCFSVYFPAFCAALYLLFVLIFFTLGLWGPILFLGSFRSRRWVLDGRLGPMHGRRDKTNFRWQRQSCKEEGINNN